MIRLENYLTGENVNRIVVGVDQDKKKRNINLNFLLNFALNDRRITIT